MTSISAAMRQASGQQVGSGNGTIASVRAGNALLHACAR
ncbi:hypothetical protein XCR_4592 [Xanthomonas campestris pv. raphani 756C]|nr:hypothetical protein XCR_4592 [Xanthomonas campestris pv. raphani 756C]